MDEEVDLLGSKKGDEVVIVGDSSLSNDVVTPMDSTLSPSLSALPPAQAHVTSSLPIKPMPIPSLAESTFFIKPKSKSSKKKNKIFGPMLKETKTSAQKPYNLPFASKKQSGRMWQMLPSMQTVSLTPSLVSSD
ncbi:hypothetical protein SLA2020_031070 [Shorea laevis]